MFSNGTEATIWIERNCRRCRRYDDDSMEGVDLKFLKTAFCGNCHTKLGIVKEATLLSAGKENNNG